VLRHLEVGVIRRIAEHLREPGFAKIPEAIAANDCHATSSLSRAFTMRIAPQRVSLSIRNTRCGDVCLAAKTHDDAIPAPEIQHLVARFEFATDNIARVPASTFRGENRRGFVFRRPAGRCESM
jgi:hypothetical protein